jgi:hypothetical protein
MEMVVRVFVESPEAQAHTAALDLERMMSAIGRVCSSMVNRYWKITTYFEVKVVVEVHGDTEKLIDQATWSLGTGWMRLRGSEALWNLGEDSTFKIADAKWAQVEVIT